MKKKVLLLGDSIRMGYDEYVKELLQEDCEVYYDDEDNGRFAAYTLWQANQLIRQYGPFDLVHWNNGYWDMNIEAPMTEAIHPLDEYLHFLKRILELVRKDSAKVVFATTLPMLPEGEMDSPEGRQFAYDDNTVCRYNAAACSLLEGEGVRINDLYALCKQHPTLYKCPDRLHLTEEGSRKCAEQVAAVIREELGL